MLCYAVHQCLMHIPTVRRKGGGNLSFFSSEYFCMSWNYIGTPYKMSIKIKTESKHLILSNRIIWKETLHNNINFAISFIVMVVKHKGYTQVGVIMWNEKSIICKDDERSSRMSRRFIEIQNPTVSHCPLLGGRGEWCEDHHIGNGRRLSKTFISVEVFSFSSQTFRRKEMEHWFGRALIFLLTWRVKTKRIQNLNACHRYASNKNQPYSMLMI